MKDPEPIKLSGEEIAKIRREVNESNLSEPTKKIVCGLIQMCLWLQLKLEKSKISIKRLKRLFFINTEKRARKKKTDTDDESEHEAPSEGTDCPEEKTNQQSTTKNSANVHDLKPKGHGRRSADEYTSAALEYIQHPDYKAGDPCPKGCGSNLYDPDEPGVFIHIEGNTLFNATRYETQTLRCTTSCGAWLKAPLPVHVNDKYSYSAKALACVLKYQMGMPHYRVAQMQERVGCPMPDTTLWDKTCDVARPVGAVFDVLVTLAAQSELFYQDDTFTRILSVMAANTQKTDKKSRTGMFTTGVVAFHEQHPIYLFLNGTKHAGENLGEVLSHRDGNLDTPIQMCDALSRNHVKVSVETILCYCLVHGRRQFVDIESLYPKDCECVLDCIAEVYKAEAACKLAQYDDEQRLKFHQEHSCPVMDKMKRFMDERVSSTTVEPNSPLYAAFQYMLKRWAQLTRFLSVAGAPLDTNTVERSLKIAIRLRKASLFFKTTRGAQVGSHMMSVIHTAVESGIEPVAYLTALQEYEDTVVKEPYQWLPWYYEETLNNLNQAKAA